LDHQRFAYTLPVARKLMPCNGQVLIMIGSWKPQRQETNLFRFLYWNHSTYYQKPYSFGKVNVSFGETSRSSISMDGEFTKNSVNPHLNFHKFT
jgi:hypothetical protein